MVVSLFLVKGSEQMYKSAADTYVFSQKCTNSDTSLWCMTRLNTEKYRAKTSTTLRQEDSGPPRRRKNTW